MMIKALLVAVLASVVGCVIYAGIMAYRERRRLAAQSLQQNQRSRKEDFYPGTPE
ncbi:hypothetical protein SAMN04487941_3996 [Pontibacter akesuensis]|uniref:Uncharacterized protein n=1 Tax=Pontibacter akesuensis TaxID=388950 RepID=A0A1I7KQS6_9BACT|nr:hypothetical protein GCM10007389_39830 [Pontibacter akesuensis]SFU99736.1 hypothetical protein SAMN04487941_3996 [Pontibacter akesuensis]